MKAQRSNRQTSSTPRRPKRGPAGAPPRSPDPTSFHAQEVFTNFQDAFTALKRLRTEVQSAFTRWSKDPPLDPNRQTRFANTLDQWVRDGRRILDGIRLAKESGRKLPRLSDCTIEERDAKRLVESVVTLEIEESLEAIFDEVQRVANRARQPLSSAEAVKLWDTFSTIVERLGVVIQEVSDLQELVESMIRRAREAESGAGGSRDYAMARLCQQPQSREMAAAVDAATVTLDSLEAVWRAIIRLKSGLTKASTDLHLTARTKRARESLLSHHEEIVTLLQQFQHHAEVFIATLESSAETKELAEKSREIPQSAFKSRISRTVDLMKELAEWCGKWLRTIKVRETVAFRVPREWIEQLTESEKILRKSRRLIDQSCDGDGAAGGSDVPARGSRRGLLLGDLFELKEDPLKVLRALLESPAPETGHDVKSLASATGFGDQKVRRIIKKNLGEEGVGIVETKKFSRKAANKSPPDVFFIRPEWVELARDACSRAGKTP